MFTSFITRLIPITIIYCVQMNLMCAGMTTCMIDSYQNTCNDQRMLMLSVSPVRVWCCQKMKSRRLLHIRISLFHLSSVFQVHVRFVSPPLRARVSIQRSCVNYSFIRNLSNGKARQCSITVVAVRRTSSRICHMKLTHHMTASAFIDG